MAAPMQHPKLGDTALVAQPFKLSKHPFRIRTAPPEAGEHTDEIMLSLGYTPQQIEAFKAKIVI
jgi:crotonobetainyl-CoA:carnitine CoA-transferase CaiB-like acyl-CoA transferase